MSSTGRSNARTKHKDDYYVTPPWVVREFMRAWRYTNDLGQAQFVLDPCAGGDNVNPMTYPLVLQEWGINMITADLRPDSPCEFPGTNFLTANFGDLKFDAILTNPPYNLAQEFVERSYEVVKPGGWIVMLLRINFLGSQKRGPWFQQYMPHSVYTHSKRPGFYPKNWKELMPELKKKGTDSTEYAHFVWQVTEAPLECHRGFVIPHVKGVSDAPGPLALAA